MNQNLVTSIYVAIPVTPAVKKGSLKMAKFVTSVVGLDVPIKMYALWRVDLAAKINVLFLESYSLKFILKLSPHSNIVFVILRSIFEQLITDSLNYCQPNMIRSTLSTFSVSQRPV